jgi:hypothetical protein
MDVDKAYFRALDWAEHNPSGAVWCVVAWTVLCIGFGSAL